MDSISEGLIKTLYLQVEKAFINLQTLLRKLGNYNNDFFFPINNSPLFGRALSYTEEIILLKHFESFFPLRICIQISYLQYQGTQIIYD